MIWPQGAFTAQTTSVTLPTKGYCKSHLTFPTLNTITLSLSRTLIHSHTQLFTQTPVVTFHVFFFCLFVFFSQTFMLAVLHLRRSFPIYKCMFFFFLHFITVFFFYILSLKFKFIAERHKLFVYHPSSFVSFTFVY